MIFNLEVDGFGILGDSSGSGLFASVNGLFASVNVKYVKNEVYTFCIYFILF